MRSQDTPVKKPSAVYSSEDLADQGAIFRTLRLQGKPCPARLAVFGNPIAHSASPPMQNAALRELQHPCQYVRICVTPEELQQAFEQLAAADFLGVNLTIPHKQAALDFVEEVSPEARLMGAVNTIKVEEGKLHGFNTDGPGFAAAVQEEFGVELGTLRVLILGGGGGAGRAISVQCALAQCPDIFVANRTLEKAEALSEQIQDTLGTMISPISLDPHALKNALASVDLIVNATSLGMTSDDPSPLSNLPLGLLTSRHRVYDSVYSGGTSALIRQAQSAGAQCANGLSMLLHQGALAYTIWWNEPAPLEIMRRALKKATQTR
jgi:shikimate dehydrogenase